MYSYIHNIKLMNFFKKLKKRNKKYIRTKKEKKKWCLEDMMKEYTKKTIIKQHRKKWLNDKELRMLT